MRKYRRENQNNVRNVCVASTKWNREGKLMRIEAESHLQMKKLENYNMQKLISTAEEKISGWL